MVVRLASSIVRARRYIFGGGGGAGPGSGGGKAQCSDGKDNDNDGKIDRVDPGCNNPLYDPNDNSEINFRIREVIPDFW